MDRSNDWGCKTIPGSRKFHLIFGSSSSDPTLLMVRDLSCFCGPCIDQDRSACENESHVSSWRLIHLRPYDTHSVRLQIEAHDDPEEWKYGGVGEELGDLLQVGENFVFQHQTKTMKELSFTFFSARNQNLWWRLLLCVHGAVTSK